MLVSAPQAGRAPARLGLRLVAVASLALASLGSAPAAHAVTAPSVLKKASIAAPAASSTVSGTISGKTCAVRWPATNRSVRITVTGPLGVRKVKAKTTKLKVRKGARKSTCTWKTKSFRDGRYRLKAEAKLRARGRWWKVSMKRAIDVQNRAGASMGTGSSGTGPQLGIGNTRYVGRLEPSWDNWISTSGKLQSGWVKQHMWGTVAHDPFFDDKLRWAPPTLAYKDLYAIYTGETDVLTQHPDWVLRDAGGNRMSIPWGCANGVCPQFAGDIGNPAFRAHWIEQAKAVLPRGYAGFWIDDANMEMRVGNSAGVEQTPIDPRTGQPMTFANWRRYIAEFLEQIRRELPSAQLVANVLWFGGSSIGRDNDPFIQRAYTAVNRLNLERGFNDDGLTNGSSVRDIFSVDAFMRFIDRMHDRGIPVTLDSIAGDRGRPAWEYNLAGYFLVDQGADAIGELSLPPGEWWSGWDLKLGAANGVRIRRPDGVYQRSFARGLALLNPPRGEAKTVKLPTAMRRIDGSIVTSVTLPAAGGAVLTTP